MNKLHKQHLLATEIQKQKHNLFTTFATCIIKKEGAS